MVRKVNFFERKLWQGLLCGLIVGLVGCAQVADKTVVTRKEALVYPPPPDEPRFYYERVIFGSASVTPQSEEDALKLALTGTSDMTNERFLKPYAIAVHRGRIFGTDTAAHMVRVFDIPQGRYFTIGSQTEDDENARLAKPMGIDVDEAGNIYVADATTRFISVYNRDGVYQRKFGGLDKFDRLTSVTVDKKGEKLYVVDIGGVTSQNHRVRVLDAKTGDMLFDFGKRGSGPGEFNLPRDVAIGKDGRLYVVDGGNFRIQVFDQDGKFIKTFGEIGKTLGSFARPKEITIDKDGNVYVIDAAFGNFQIFDPEGQLLMFIGDRSEEQGPAHFMLPSGIAVDENGRVYVVDQYFKKIDIFRPAALGKNEGYLQYKQPAKK